MEWSTSSPAESSEERWCNGKLAVLFADESSYVCTVCGWSGWPRQTVEPGTGRVLEVFPHPRRFQQQRLPLA
jgi:hypothetical protein